MTNQDADIKFNTAQEEISHGRLIGIRLFGIVYAFVGLLIACFKFMLSSFLFPVFLSLLVILEGVSVMIAGIGVIYLKELYRVLLLMTAYVAAFVFFYIMFFERGIILYFANGAQMRLIPYSVSIPGFCFFGAAIFYFSSLKTKKLFHPIFPGTRGF